MKEIPGKIASAVAVMTIVATLSTTAKADFRNMRIGPRPRAMGSAFVAVANDANAVYWNPAGMVFIDRFELTGCRTMLYSVDDLSNDFLSGVYSTRFASFGLSWMRLGLKDIYHEDTINLAVARRMPFLKGLSAGLSFKLFVLSAPGYEKYNDPGFKGRDIAPSYDIGVHYSSGGNWTLGFVLYNVNEPKLKLIETTKTPDPVYREYSLGVSYIFRGMLLTTFELKTLYGEQTKTVGRFGSEIWFFDAVALRGGFEREHMTAGFGLKGNYWQIDLMLETHYELGNTYQFSATIRM
ncbi:MAG: hypothetical protein B6D63_04165 [Candidatus Latescibacteria bacterium 4484_7]|nr:MAG: hypothetical protein B6D63_04165 [Candidatus Latescibacteria bacterium 4484_7]